MATPHKPEISKFLDDEEKDLVEAIESTDHRSGPSGLTPARLADLQAAARQTIAEERTRNSRHFSNKH